MEGLLIELNSPQTVVAIILALFIVFIEPIIAKIRGILVAALRRVPILGKGALRAIRLRNKKEIKRLRHNPAEITFQIVRAHTYYLLFWLAVMCYLALLFFGPLRGLANLPKAVQLFVATPIYAFEVLWLMQSERAKILIDNANKIRLRNRPRI